MNTWLDATSDSLLCIAVHILPSRYRVRLHYPACAGPQTLVRNTTKGPGMLSCSLAAGRVVISAVVAAASSQGTSSNHGQPPGDGMCDDYCFSFTRLGATRKRVWRRLDRYARRRGGHGLFRGANKQTTLKQRWESNYGLPRPPSFIAGAHEGWEEDSEDPGSLHPSIRHGGILPLQQFCGSADGLCTMRPCGSTTPDWCNSGLVSLVKGGRKSYEGFRFVYEEGWLPRADMPCDARCCSRSVQREREPF